MVGPQNKMAYAAARAVAEKPAEHYNPLFIYSDSGLGKTHLLYAIAHQVRQRQPEARIVYILSLIHIYAIRFYGWEGKLCAEVKDILMGETWLCSGQSNKMCIRDRLRRL